ncbi:MAG: hypothetical protein KIT63_24000 [Rhodoferax sp.]|nr:hypothetical protein [Rhodoferax sp.]
MPHHSFAIAVQGSATLVRAVADVMGETIGEYYRALEWEENPAFPRGVVSLQQDERVRNIGFVDIAGVLSIFVLSWFSKKILDEVYDRTAKRPIAEFLDKVFSTANIQKGKALEFRDVMYLEDIDTVVVIRAMINGEDTMRVTELMLQGHKFAHSYLEANGRVAPVHCHTIEDGSIQLEPRFFSSLAQLNHEMMRSSGS